MGKTILNMKVKRSTGFVLLLLYTSTGGLLPRAGNLTSTAGILITGGISREHILWSAELFVPELNKSCSLDSMREYRYQHSLAGLMSCGGTGNYDDHCEVFSPGSGWSLEPYDLTERRSGHTSWTLSNGTVLLL